MLAAMVVCTCLSVVVAVPATAAPALPAGFEQSAAALGFSQPTAFAYTPDGRMFVAEKPGRVRVVAPGATAPQPGSVINITDHVNSQSDRGLLGLAVDADYASNHYVYLLYSYEHNALDARGEKVSKLTRFKVGLNNNLESGETTILGTSALTSCPAPDGNFANDVDCIPSEYLWHSIGTVKSDPTDGTLWIGTGDSQMSLNFSEKTLQTQSEESYRGKILHVDRNGNGLPGHSYCPAVTDLTKPCTKIYAKGFRNPFRFTLRPGKGPIAGDVGADHREELDLVQQGGNYGWPCYEGNIRNAVHESSATCQSLYAQGANAVEAPVWDYVHNGGNAIAAGPQYSGSTYPSSYGGDIFVADFAQGWIKRLKVDSNDALQSVQDFATFPEGEGAPVDLQQLPNGDVGYLDIGYQSNAGGLYRFRYTPTNASPVARATGTPLSGAAPLTVSFDASGSTDANGDELTYSWDFGDGSTGTGPRPTHTYTQAGGNHTARVTVSDGRGGTSSATVGPITPGNSPPTASISAPPSFRYGQPITVTGSATDAQDGTEPGSRMTWTVLQQHGNHTHPFTGCTGTATCTFNPGNDHDADSFFKVTLLVTDSNGATGQKTVEVRPQTVALTLASSPPGAPLGYSTATPAAAPSTYTAAVGFAATVIAPETWTSSGGTTYNFRSWSDLGARQHVYSVPATNATLTANYNAWPTARVSADRTSGPAPLTVTFDAGASTDPDGDALSYAWSFGDGSTGSGRTPTHRYTSSGLSTVTLTVTDGRGGSDQETTVVAVGQRPVATIDAPGDGSLFDAGQRIQLQGRGSDDQGTPRLAWRVDLHRDSGITPVTLSGNAFTVPAVVTPDAWYEVTLTATDTDGLTATDVVRIDPHTSTLRLDSDPAGATLSLNGATVTAPASALAVVSTQATVAAPASFDSGGRRWLFASWSNGGAREQTITVPGAGTLLTARFGAESPPVAPPPSEPALPGQPPVSPQPTRPQGQAERRPLRLRLNKRGVALTRAGSVQFVLRNPNDTGWGGNVVLSSTAKVRAGGAKARRVRFARKTVVLRPHATEAIKLTLTPAGRRLVARLGRVRVTLALEGAGASPSSQAQTVLLAPRRRR